jgi:hypothetical protein
MVFLFSPWSKTDIFFPKSFLHISWPTRWRTIKKTKYRFFFFQCGLLQMVLQILICTVSLQWIFSGIQLGLGFSIILGNMFVSQLLQ